MAILGAIIAIGAALAFALIGALTLFGGANSTDKQVLPGFRPDQPGPLVRLLTLASVWVPVAFVAVLCLLAAVQIFRVALGLR